MIPYVPEGPPPLDEEDVGSPPDTPMGFPVVPTIDMATEIPFGNFETFSCQTGHDRDNDIDPPDRGTNMVESADVEFRKPHPLPLNEEKLSNDKTIDFHCHTNDTLAKSDEGMAYENDFDDFQFAAPLSDLVKDNGSSVEAKVDVSECHQTQVNDSTCEDAQFEIPKRGSADISSLEENDENVVISSNSYEFSNSETLTFPEEQTTICENKDHDLTHPCYVNEDLAAFPGVEPPEERDVGLDKDTSETIHCGDAGLATSPENDEFGGFNDYNESAPIESNMFPVDFTTTKTDNKINNNVPDSSASGGHDIDTCENVGSDNGIEFEGFKSFETPGDCTAENDNDDDFGDFGDFSQPANFQNNETPNTVDSEEFGTFSQPDAWQNSAENANSQENFEFASFDAAHPDINGGSTQWNSQPGGLLEKILDKMETVLSSCFVLSEEIANESLSLDSLNVEPGNSDNEDGIWTFLVDFDKAFALQYQLTKSLGNDCFLKALNIDSRNVLKNPKKPTLPIFASQLGLLEPTRGTAEGGKDNTALDPTVAPSDSDSSIPAPEFDWNSSGLTNPLDKLEEQFLCKELTHTIGSVNNEVKLDPVQSILTQATRGSSIPPDTMKSYSELSATAQAYIDSLPDLNYMKARVLMFPIGHS